MKTPEEILDSKICTLEYGHYTYSTVIEAMESYHAQFSNVTDEDIIDYALHYVSHKDLKPANRGLIKDALIIGAKAYRDGLIKSSPVEGEI